MNVKISVIIPAYNIAGYIENCLKSVLDQTYPNLEIIVVDDGSADDTGKIADQCAQADPRVRVIHQENGGVTRARLRGVREATGEYIGFVDGDDVIVPDMYERLLANALKYHADISHCGYRMVFPNRVDYYYNTGRLAQQDRTTGLKDLLEGSFIEPGLWNKLFHKSLFHSLLHGEKMPADIRNMEDLLMNFYLFSEATLSIYEDFCPYHYLVRKESAANMELNEHQLKDPLRVFEILQEETAGEPELLPIAKRKVLNGVIMGATIEVRDQPAFVREFRGEMRRRMRRLLPEVLKDAAYGKKEKLKALFAGIWPGGYQCVHAIYAKATGLDKIYDIE